jgi:hypothetical protein
MLTGVVIQVDEIARCANSSKGGVDGFFDGRDERDDGAIV